MICAHCYQSFKIQDIQQQRGSGLAGQVQCPKCEAWIGRSPTLAKLKMIGFYSAIAAALFAYLVPSWAALGVILAIFALMLLVVSHFMDQLKTIEPPPQVEVDDQEHRRKYR